MKIKTFIAAAVIALTAACTDQTEAPEAEATSEIDLNDDGSIKTVEIETVAPE